MKFVISLLAAASLAAAQSNPLNEIPKCAQDCVGQYLTGSNIAGCSLVDYKCVCSNEKFINDIACCLEPVCDDKGKADTIALANKLCKAFNVNLPTVVTCNTAAATASSSGSATPSGSAISSGSATSSPGATPTTNAASSGTSGATSSGAAASTSSKAAAAPTNVAGLVGAAAALAFAL